MNLREQIARVLDDQIMRETDAVLALFAEPSEGLVEQVAAAVWSYLWSGEFEEGLLKLSIFTPEQAAESAAKKRAEKCALVRDILRAIGESDDE
ncbi:hypothetical protein [Gulosibacter molinativorax]|uniref:DNA topoisomerase (ATP-hydrolyzing) n=1 Tax=Gulosibacter molinativorax TaxID=256821 RepID=A0ABT7C7B1_9MICO|nr:hypothetical protein [Gulosibacter molinativorax]MDJ1370649.1 hypothetical protein [Gulosibacter molinativorax]QUY63326.1 Hypotetical protein [Gulosibacter molinativorax]